MRDNPLVVEKKSANGAEPRFFVLRGPLTIANLFPFQSALREGGPVTTIVDLSEVPYVDSAGIGVLVNAYVSCNNAHKAFLLAGVNGRVREVLKVTHVDQVFKISPTLADAESFLRAAAPN